MFYIFIGTVHINDIDFENRCISYSDTSFDGCIESDSIVWADTEHQPYDYKALFNEVEDTVLNEDGEEVTVVRKEYTGEFVLDPIPIPIDNSIEIAELKQKLADTDYVIIKIAEGVATTEEYAEIIEQRSEWRSRINELV